LKRPLNISCEKKKRRSKKTLDGMMKKNQPGAQVFSGFGRGEKDGDCWRLLEITMVISPIYRGDITYIA